MQPTLTGQGMSISQTSTARPTMAQVPNVITTKDAAYLKDQMAWLLLAAKKCAHFAAECQSSEIQNVIKRIGQMHERQYQTLLKYLQTDNASVMQNVPRPQGQGQSQSQGQAPSQGQMQSRTQTQNTPGSSLLNRYSSQTGTQNPQ